MISVFSVITLEGDVLLEEKYRNDISDEHVKSLITLVMKCNDGNPYVKVHDVRGYFIQRDKVIYLAVSKKELPSIVIIKFLESFYTLVRNFCGGATVDHITKNLLLVYELMTECIDTSLIKTTNTEQIRHSIYSDPAVFKSSQSTEIRKPGPFGMEKIYVSNSAAEKPLVKSRSEQVMKSPEVFVDVIEKLTVCFSKEGLIERFNLHGVIQVKSFISLNHRLIINLDKKLKQDLQKELSFDHCSFDSCVDSTSFEKVQSFIVRPTQGQIDAMIYTMENPVCLPFRLAANIRESEENKDCDLTLKLTSNLPSEVHALNIALHIPVSSRTKNVMQQFSMYENYSDFVRKERKIVWKLKKLPGQAEVVGKFKLVDAMQVPANRLEMGPITLEFEASNTTASGLSIRNLRAEDPSGKPLPIQKWVRYVTLPHSYVFRI